MNDNNNISRPERRKHPRLYVGQNVIGATMPDYTNMGRMIEIGRGGLSFNYIDQDYGESRSGTDRRQFSYSKYLPERRSG
jgi:hypothetical protein